MTNELEQKVKPAFSVIKSDAIEWLKSLKDESIDLAVTDPAYESLEKYRAIGTTTRLKNEWFDIFPNNRFPELFFQFYRVLKKNTHLYMFCDAETAFIIKPMGEAAGFKFWKPIVWQKVSIGMGYHYRNQYEFIMFFEKGKRKLNNLSISDIISEKRVIKKYPTEKPVRVSEVLISQSGKSGELVIDPFCGSGSIGEAVINQGLHFLGCDNSEKAVELTRTRLIDCGGIEK